jgi:hypothetical protein
MHTRASASNESNGSSSSGASSNGNGSGNGNGNGVSHLAPDAAKKDRRFLKWAKMSLKELGKLSLTEELEAARAQQDFSRDPNRVPKVQNKASVWLNCTLTMYQKGWPVIADLAAFNGKFTSYISSASLVACGTGAAEHVWRQPWQGPQRSQNLH